MKDYSQWLYTAIRTSQSLEFVPAEFKTYELCLDAVDNDGLALRHIP
jgi:hypothetical protein